MDETAVREQEAKADEVPAVCLGYLPLGLRQRLDAEAEGREAAARQEEKHDHPTTCKICGAKLG